MDPDWLGASRRAAQALSAIMADNPTTAERVVETGERGEGTYVIVDPIDGSMNAKRGISHHALSIAVADGETMGDVVFGYVYDLGPGEEWVAERGAGAQLDGADLDASLGERRNR